MNPSVWSMSGALNLPIQTDSGKWFWQSCDKVDLQCSGSLRVCVQSERECERLRRESEMAYSNAGAREVALRENADGLLDDIRTDHAA